MENNLFKIKAGELLGVQQKPSPNFNQRSQQAIDLLVIHSISLPPGVYGGTYIDDLFCNQLDCSIHPYFEHLQNLEVSAHVLIRRDGELTQFVNFEQRAWHAGQSCYRDRDNCNDFSIGVELEGLEGETFDKIQYKSLAKLTASLMQVYPGITRETICGHSDISPGRKFDPGAGFDWNYYFALLDKSMQGN